MVAEGRQNGTDVGQNGATGCKICPILKSFVLKIVGHSVLFFITVGKTAKHIQETSERFQNWRAFRFVFHCIL